MLEQISLTRLTKPHASTASSASAALFLQLRVQAIAKASSFPPHTQKLHYTLNPAALRLRPRSLEMINSRRTDEFLGDAL